MGSEACRLRAYVIFHLADIMYSYMYGSNGSDLDLQMNIEFDLQNGAEILTQDKI